jgi:hypothetical protein
MVPYGIALLGFLLWAPLVGELNTEGRSWTYDFNGSWAYDFNGNGQYDLLDYLTYLVGWFNPFSAFPVVMEVATSSTRTILLKEHIETEELTTSKPFDGIEVYCVISSQDKQKAFSTKTSENGKAHVSIGSIIKDFVGDDVMITISDK